MILIGSLFFLSRIHENICFLGIFHFWHGLVEDNLE